MTNFAYRVRPDSVARRRDRSGEVAMGRIGADRPCAVRAACTTPAFHPATKSSVACIRLQPPQAL